MGLARHSSFFRRLVTRHPVAKEEDPADLGTAFGLEASLGPVSVYPDKADGAAELAAADDSPMGWLGRRVKRSR